MVFSTSNNFSVLGDLPESPSSVSTMRALHTSTPDRSGNRHSKHKSAKTLRVLNINFQSVKTKQGELLNLIESSNPDVIFGTETWIDPSIKDSQFLPPGFTTYRKDRNLGGGGVIIAIKNELLTSAVPEFETDCEIVWCKLNLVGHRAIYLSCFYNPKTSNEEGYLNYYKSMERACRVNNAVILSAGDFNLPGINWESNDVKKGTQYVGIHNKFLDTINDLGLTQIVVMPTRGNNTLDLIMTNHPSSINRVELMRGLSDHDIVNVEPVKFKH